MCFTLISCISEVTNSKYLRLHFRVRHFFVTQRGCSDVAAEYNYSKQNLLDIELDRPEKYILKRCDVSDSKSYCLSDEK